jgi:hypothetical protein
VAVDDAIEVVPAGNGLPRQPSATQDALGIHPGGIALLQIRDEAQSLIIQIVTN